MFFVVKAPHNFFCSRTLGICLLCLLILLFLAGMPGIATADTSTSPTDRNTVDRQYKQAVDYYYTLRNNPSLAGKREKWLTGIYELQRIYRIDPKNKRAVICLYTIARMYRAMHERFGITEDIDKAVSFYKDIVTFFPKGKKADNALYALARIEQEEKGNFKQAVQYYDQLMRFYPTSSKKRSVKRQLKKLIAFLEKNPDYKDKSISPSTANFSFATAVSHSSAVRAMPRTAAVSKARTNSRIQPVEKTVVSKPEKKVNRSASSASSAPQRTMPPPVYQQPALRNAKKEVQARETDRETVPKTKIILSALRKVESTREKNEENTPEKSIQPETRSGTVQQTGNSSPPRLHQPKEKYLKKTPGTVDVLPIQYWSSDNYSRVVIKSSNPVSYQADLLDQQSGRPRRLFIDFKKSYISPKYRSPVNIEDGLLKRIHTDQLDPTTVRVYLDTQSIADYKVFNLKDPFRVVVDVRGGKGRAALRVPKKKVAPRIITDIKQAVQHPLLVQSGKKKEAAGEKKAEVAKSEAPPVLENLAKSTLPSAPEIKTVKVIRPGKRKTVPGAAESKKAPAGENLTLAQQLGLGVRRIVIDPGHGGKDPGAVAFGLKEKDIVLNVAKKIRKILEKKNGYEVILTREGDVSLSLEERTAIANTKEADLFLSVHVNAHPEEGVRGVETFYLNLATHTEAMRVAALENATSTHNMSEMQDILAELMQNEKINESSQLAEFVQINLINGLKEQNFYVKDLGVKQAPFYVLIGAEMPAILAEISFITNRHEAKLMKNERYLQTLAEQIAAGVLSYAEKQRTAALKKGT